MLHFRNTFWLLFSSDRSLYIRCNCNWGTTRRPRAHCQSVY